MSKIKRIIWLVKTYGISLPFAFKIVFVTDKKMTKGEEA